MSELQVGDYAVFVAPAVCHRGIQEKSGCRAEVMAKRAGPLGFGPEVFVLRFADNTGVEASEVYVKPVAPHIPMSWDAFEHQVGWRPDDA